MSSGLTTDVAYTKNRVFGRCLKGATDISGSGQIKETKGFGRIAGTEGGKEICGCRLTRASH